MSAANVLRVGGPSDKTIVIAGWATCPYFMRASQTAQTIAKAHPQWAQFEVVSFPGRSEFQEWRTGPAEQGRPTTAAAANHASSPFVYFKNGTFIGLVDLLQAEWSRVELTCIFFFVSLFKTEETISFRFVYHCVHAGLHKTLRLHRSHTIIIVISGTRKHEWCFVMKARS